MRQTNCGIGSCDVAEHQVIPPPPPKKYFVVGQFANEMPYSVGFKDAQTLEEANTSAANFAESYPDRKYTVVEMKTTYKTEKVTTSKTVVTQH